MTMINNGYIRHNNLSVAWAQALLAVISAKRNELIPLIVMVDGVTNGYIEENQNIREILSQTLKEKGEFRIETVANTIFPKSLWNPLRGRNFLFDRYRKCWPIIKKCPQNRRGTYFRRFIDYESNQQPVNQLEHVINTWSGGNHRHSALQIGVFDPRKDHTNALSALVHKYTNI